MVPPPWARLSRREREILDVLYKRGEAAVAEIVPELRGSSYNAIRVTLTVLERKEIVTHRKVGNRYVYAPRMASEHASRSAMSHILKTFFHGSPGRALVALLEVSEGGLKASEIQELSALITAARQKKSK